MVVMDASNSIHGVDTGCHRENDIHGYNDNGGDKRQKELLLQS